MADPEPVPDTAPAMQAAADEAPATDAAPPVDGEEPAAAAEGEAKRKDPPPPGGDGVSGVTEGEQPAKKSKKSKKFKTNSAGPSEATAATGAVSGGDMVKIVPADKTEVEREVWRPVGLDKKSAAPQMRIEEDGRTVTSWKGYRMARATHGAKVGTWYFEVEVVHLGETGHARMGWSTKKADIQAPVGYDQHSFCYRDIDGTKVHKARREPYGEGYAEGDVLGFFIHLPVNERVREDKPKELVVWKGGVYYLDEREVPPEPLEGSLVAFSKNGKLQGVAYRDVLEGAYHPAVSIYTLPKQGEGASVKFNFGPDFKHSPPEVEGCPPAKPACEMAGEPPPPPPPPPVFEDGVAGGGAEEGSGGDAAGGAGGEQQQPGAEGGGASGSVAEAGMGTGAAGAAGGLVGATADVASAPVPELAPAQPVPTAVPPPPAAAPAPVPVPVAPTAPAPPAGDAPMPQAPP